MSDATRYYKVYSASGFVLRGRVPEDVPGVRLQRVGQAQHLPLVRPVPKKRGRPSRLDLRKRPSFLW